MGFAFLRFGASLHGRVVRSRGYARLFQMVLDPTLIFLYMVVMPEPRIQLGFLLTEGQSE